MGSNTLSSHEPFDVPVKTVIPGKDEEHLFLNSAHYTDASLGDFIREAQKAPWWKNTLIIMVADHGSRHPGNSPYNMPVKFHIPMLWLGGALKTRDTIVSTFCSQTDIPYTLLRQMNLDDKNFIFSKDILSSSSPGFSFYMFNDGFGFLGPQAKMVFDNKAGKVIFRDGNVDDSFIEKGKSIMQVLSDEFSRR